jgi:hypothetical protein
MVMQVKQKFGELRFYTRPKLSEVEALIGTARTHSLHTCEVTGAPGELCRLPMTGLCCYHTLSPAKAAELGFIPVA